MQSAKIHKFQVHNFRNLKNDIYEFSPGINCIFGQNGNGKTNLLEAIYFLITHKSFKKNINFPHLLSVECAEPEIIFSSSFKVEDEVQTYSGKVSPDKQEWYLNTKPHKKKHFTMPILVNPFDAYNYYLQSSIRRDFFDNYFSILSDEYNKTLKNMRKSLKMRNSILSNKGSQLQLKSLDQNFSQYCHSILHMRMALSENLNEYIPQVFKDIFSMDHDLRVDVESKWKGYTEGDIFSILQNGYDLEYQIGHTKYSVHKDDYTLLFDGFKASEFCSLGQQKTSYLSLLFAYIELFRYKFKTFPLVLLDDLSGELDETRWKCLVRYLEQQKFQVLITSANEKFREELNKISMIKNFAISSGCLIQ